MGGCCGSGQKRDGAGKYLPATSPEYAPQRENPLLYESQGHLRDSMSREPLRRSLSRDCVEHNIRRVSAGEESMHESPMQMSASSFHTCMDHCEGDAIAGDVVRLVVPRAGRNINMAAQPNGYGAGRRFSTGPRERLAQDGGIRRHSSQRHPPGQTYRRLPHNFGHHVPRGGKAPSKVMNSWDYTTDADSREFLRNGGICYTFCCSAGGSLGARERRMIDSIVHLTTFADELRENNVPGVNMQDDKEISSLIFVINKGSYIMPAPLDPTELPAELLSNHVYERNCQPSGTSVWEDRRTLAETSTFRITKAIVPVILKMTIQFRCSQIPDDVLPSLSPLIDGLQVTAGVLLERTKRDKSKQDSTRKAKSVYLMSRLDGGGFLVANVTAVAQGSVPTVFARMVDLFGGMGAKEVAETADRTRKYMLDLNEGKQPRPI